MLTMNIREHDLIILALQISGCLSIATYEIFKGFDVETSNNKEAGATSLLKSAVGLNHNQTENINKSIAEGMDFAEKIFNITMPVKFTTPEPSVNVTERVKFVCPEEERPSNIGPYEVPTQRDLALLTKKTLKRMFGSYHQKALFFLEDIKKATRATMEVERQCLVNKAQYKQCVRHVSSQCEAITKGLVISLEQQRHDIAAYSESSVCSLSGMKEDPVKLIKLLAMEEASLEFALPAFLRLLSSCANICIVEPFKQPSKPLLRHMSDTDLVVKHFLTKKNYKQLISD